MSRISVLLALIVLTVVSAAASAAFLYGALTGLPPGLEGATLLLSLGVAIAFFISSFAALMRPPARAPSVSRLARNGLQTYGAGWLLGVLILGARQLVDALANWGATPMNGSYVADAVFFILAAAIVGIPGVVALALAALVARLH